MEYCCLVWAAAHSCCLEFLDKLQKRICKTVGPSLAASLKPLVHRQDFSIGITLIDVHLNWLNWFHFLFLEGGLLFILLDFMIFFVTIARCYKDVYISNSFLAQLDSGTLCL